MTTNSVMRTIVPVAVLCGVVFIVVVPWHMSNQRIPIWDGADYVINAQRICDQFQIGFLKGLHALYLDRGWRPISFSAFAVPYFAVFSGKILPSVAATNFAYVLIIGLYSFFTLRNIVGTARALIGGALLTSVQWIVAFSTIFYSELLWLAATSGAIFHILTGFQRKSTMHFVLGGLWLGIMASVRPVETTVLIGVPAAALLTRYWLSRRISTLELAVFLLQLAFAAGAVALATLPMRHDLGEISCLALAALLIAFRGRAFFISAPALGGLITAEAVAVGWNLPSMRALYLWVYETSFGSMAQQTDQRFSHVSPLQIVGSLLDHYTPAIIEILAALCALMILGSFRKYRSWITSAPVALVSVAVLAAMPMIAMYSITGTSDYRRMMPAVLVLYTGLIGLALLPHEFLRRGRAAVLCIVAVGQVIVTGANGFNIQLPVFAGLQRFTGPLPKPVTSADPNGTLLDGLLALGIRKGRIDAYTYCFFDLSCEGRGFPMFEPLALSSLANERHVPIFAHYVGDLVFAKPETLAAQLRDRNFNYILIDMFDDPHGINFAIPYVEATKQFISLERKGLPPGLVAKGCVTALNRPICVIAVEPDATSKAVSPAPRD